MQRIAVSILTNGARRAKLQVCFESFLSNTSCRDIVFCVFDNGSTDDTWTWLRGYDFGGCPFYLDRSEKDLGCAAGTNRAAEMARGFKYALHLESDFLMLPGTMSGSGR